MASLAQVPTLSRRRAVHFGSAGVALVLAAGGQRSALAGDQSTLEANKAIARRVFEEGFNRRNLAALEELYAPEFVDRGAWARQMPGPAGMPITTDEFHDLFPDLVATVDGAIAEDDLVATRVTWRGTHPPAGVHMVGRTMHVFHLESGQIVAQWSVGWDWLAPYSCQSAPPWNSPHNPLEAS